MQLEDFGNDILSFKNYLQQGSMIKVNKLIDQKGEKLNINNKVVVIPENSTYGGSKTSDNSHLSNIIDIRSAQHLADILGHKDSYLSLDSQQRAVIIVKYDFRAGAGIFFVENTNRGIFVNLVGVLKRFEEISSLKGSNFEF